MNQRKIWIGGFLAVLLFEAATVAIRVMSGVTAHEFNETNPLVLLQIHHMFWAVPFLIVGAVLVSLKRPAQWCWIVSIGLIGSDLVHHFVVLPLWVGNTGWHWP